MRLRTIDELLILLFWEIVEKQNPLMLDKDFDHAKEYSDEEIAKARDLWLDIYDEYFILENDSFVKAVLMKQSRNFNDLAKIQKIQETLEMIMYCCNARAGFTQDEFDEIIQKLYSIIKKYEPRVNIQYFDAIEKNIEIINKWLVSLANTYEINHKRNDSDIKRTARNFYEKVAEVGRKLNMQLNINKMKVKEWIAWKKEADKRIAASQTSNKTDNGER